MAVKTNYTKNGINYFRITRTIGKKVDGSPIKKEFYGASKKEAEEKAEEYLGNLKRGLNINYDKVTVAEAVEHWLFNELLNSSNFKPTSFQRYEGVYRNYIKDSEIGGYLIYSLKKEHIQNHYYELYKSGASESKIRNINKVLKTFFNYCIRNDIILKNPCEFVTIPTTTDTYDEDKEDLIISVFNEEEIKTIINNINYKDTSHMIIFLALITGLRLGEILALKKKFVDLDSQVIKVRLTLARVKVFESTKNYHWELSLQKPKTESSIRVVDIPDNAINIIKQYIALQEIKYSQLGLTFGDDDLLFTTDSCKKIDNSNFKRAWARFLKRINIDYKKFHSTRHTYASILFKNGASILEVKSLLGHSNLKTTEKIYIHIFPDSKKSTSNKLNYIIPKTESGKSREKIK